MSSEADVIVQQNGACGLITLNRPKALHALNHEIVNGVIAAYSRWLAPGSCVTRAILKGQGDKAFCAGGDVKGVVLRAMAGDWQHGASFFRAEYCMNYLLARMPLPQVALVDGITMGGGAGISMHSPFRVATERTLFAMPECSIGLFPDVGASLFLNRLPRGLGLFLALTGTQLRGADVLHAGLATHFVRAERLGALEGALIALDSSDLTRIDACIARFADPVLPDDAHISEVKRVAQRCCAGDAAGSVGSILQALQECSADSPDVCGKALEGLARASPLSLTLTREQLHRGAALPPRGCFEMEFRLAARCTRGPSDFAEGVRCRLIDRGASPAWRHASPGEVPAADVAAFFEPLDFCTEIGDDLAAIDALLRGPAL